MSCEEERSKCGRIGFDLWGSCRPADMRMIGEPPRGARDSVLVSVGVGVYQLLIVVLFEPGLNATVVFIVLRLLLEDSRRLLAAVGRDIEEDGFDG